MTNKHKFFQDSKRIIQSSVDYITSQISDHFIFNERLSTVQTHAKPINNSPLFNYSPHSILSNNICLARSKFHDQIVVDSCGICFGWVPISDFGSFFVNQCLLHSFLKHFLLAQQTAWHVSALLFWLCLWLFWLWLDHIKLAGSWTRRKSWRKTRGILLILMIIYICKLCRRALLGLLARMAAATSVAAKIRVRQTGRNLQGKGLLLFLRRCSDMHTLRPWHNSVLLAEFYVVPESRR